ncbi:MAG: efflux RND transporter permease subunit, partial [Firmicutes bacterium]|nr:efflux RND transporter permease subunit [Bacillota bacterium]
MPKFSVKKPMTVFVVVVVIIALGIVSTLKMTPDLLPSIDLPYVVVMTTYPGATPEEVEATVSRPLEQSLATLENLKSIQSVSNANYSLIMLEFENGSNMDTAVVNTLQSVDLIEGSWDDSIGSPNILKINPTMLPIAIAAVDMEGTDMESMSSFVENTLLNELEGITGVASISTGGMIESKVNVVINEDKIEKLNDELLGDASPDLAEARAQLNKGLSELKKAEAKIAESRAELETTKDETYDQLADAAAQLDTGVAQAGALTTQIKTLEGRKMAIQAQLEQQLYAGSMAAMYAEQQTGTAITVTKDQLESQLADVESQLTILQMDSAAADAQLQQLQQAYRDAQRGSFDAIEGFDDAEAQLDKAQNQIVSQRSQLNSAMAQLDEAANNKLLTEGLSSMITMDMVSGILQGQNFSMPAGYVQSGDTRYLVSVGDKLEDEKDIKNLFLFDIEGLGKVYLKDVADVFISDNSDAVYGSINGNPSIMLTFSKQSNYPTATVSNNIADKFEELSAEYEGLSFTMMMDQGDYIYLIIGAIGQSLGYGALFAILVLLFFLRDLKPTFITLLSIPV